MDANTAFKLESGGTIITFILYTLYLMLYALYLMLYALYLIPYTFKPYPPISKL
jgi:hypothetical protein